MQFRVVAGDARADTSTPPEQLVLPAPPPLRQRRDTRQVSLNEEDSGRSASAPMRTATSCSTAPTASLRPAVALLGTVAGGAGSPLRWDDPITENPAVGATEVWEMYNFTEDAHPIHIHEITFEVVNRASQFGGRSAAPEPWESGRKDTVIAYPGEITRVEGALRPRRPVRLALPHRRARGPRDDAPIPDRTLTGAQPTRPQPAAVCVRSCASGRRQR